MATVHDIRKAKKFLTNDQECDLIDALAYHTRGGMRRKINNVIHYHFLSLECRDYWEDFQVTVRGVSYTGDSISKVRKDILSQVEG